MDTNVNIKRHEKLIAILEMIARNEAALQEKTAYYNRQMNGAQGGRKWNTFLYYSQSECERDIANMKAVSERLISYYNGQLAKCSQLIKTAKPKGTMLIEALNEKGGLL